nr:MAG TPA: hypothetical protein [Caudoviricetes sp.]
MSPSISILIPLIFPAIFPPFTKNRKALRELLRLDNAVRTMNLTSESLSQHSFFSLKTVKISLCGFPFATLVLTP